MAVPLRIEYSVIVSEDTESPTQPAAAGLLLPNHLVAFGDSNADLTLNRWAPGKEVVSPSKVQI